MRKLISRSITNKNQQKKLNVIDRLISDLPYPETTEPSIFLTPKQISELRLSMKTLMKDYEQCKIKIFNLESELAEYRKKDNPLDNNSEIDTETKTSNESKTWSFNNLKNIPRKKSWNYSTDNLKSKFLSMPNKGMVVNSEENTGSISNQMNSSFKNYSTNEYKKVESYRKKFNFNVNANDNNIDFKNLMKQNNNGRINVSFPMIRKTKEKDETFSDSNQEKVINLNRNPYAPYEHKIDITIKSRNNTGDCGSVMNQSNNSSVTTQQESIKTSSTPRKMKNSIMHRMSSSEDEKDSESRVPNNANENLPTNNMEQNPKNFSLFRPQSAIASTVVGKSSRLLNKSSRSFERKSQSRDFQNRYRSMPDKGMIVSIDENTTGSISNQANSSFTNYVTNKNSNCANVTYYKDNFNLALQKKDCISNGEQRQSNTGNSLNIAPTLIRKTKSFLRRPSSDLAPVNEDSKLVSNFV